MAISFIAASSSYSTGSSGSTNLFATFPSTVAANDILVLHFCHSNNISQSDAVYTATTSWTPIISTSGSFMRSWSYAKRAVGTETGTTTVFVSSGTSDTKVQTMRIYSFRGVTTEGSFIEGATAFANLSTISTMMAVDVTTLGPNRMAVQFIMNSAGSTVHTSLTGEIGTDYTLINQTSGPSAIVGFQTGSVSSAMTVTGGIESSSSIGWITIGFALIPASTGGGSTWISAYWHSLDMDSPTFIPISFDHHIPTPYAAG